MGRIGSFVKEARRRRVFRLAALYVVSIWILLQVADVLFPALNIPDAAKLYLLLGGLLCFPLALLFGWRYELTRHGLVRTPAPDTGEAQNLSLDRADYVILSALAAVIVAVSLGLGVEILDEQRPAANFDGVPVAKSIAVLPFRNLSGSEEQEYFSDGITEEILNNLGQIGDIHLVGRTSSFRFKDSAEDLRYIGEQLGVANILEGSVRRFGNRLRITAQLVDASTGFSLWSQVYERELADVFNIQSEIATSIGDALESTFAVEKNHSRTGRTENLDAYNFYLRGNFLAQSGDDSERAAELFMRAIELDPDFAPPYYGYVWNCLNAAWRVISEECKERAEPFIYRLQQLAPDSAEVDIGFSLLYELRDKNLAASRAALERALERHPNDVTVLRNLAYVLAFEWGEYELAIEHYQKLFELEPLFESPRLSYAGALTYLNRLTEARQQIEISLELSNHPWNDFALASVAFAELDYVEGLRHSYRSVERGLEPFYLIDAALELENEEDAFYWAEQMNMFIPGSYVALLMTFKVNYVSGNLSRATEISQQLAAYDVSPSDLEYGAMSSIAWLRHLHRDSPSSALVTYTRNYPGLFDDDIILGMWNLAAAISLAELHMQQGEARFAERLLEKAANYLATSTLPYYHETAALRILQGNTQAAIEVLKAYADSNNRFGWWILEKDPIYEPLWSNPDFAAIIRKIRDDMGQRLEEISELERRGQLAAFP